MRPPFGNPRFHWGMTLLAGAIALGFLGAAGYAFSTSKVAGAVFLLLVGLLFVYWSWAGSPTRVRRVPIEHQQRRRDQLNALFAFLRIRWLVDPSWTERRKEGND